MHEIQNQVTKSENAKKVCKAATSCNISQAREECTLGYMVSSEVKFPDCPRHHGRIGSVQALGFLRNLLKTLFCKRGEMFPSHSGSFVTQIIMQITRGGWNPHIYTLHENIK